MIILPFGALSANQRWMASASSWKSGTGICTIRGTLRLAKRVMGKGAGVVLETGVLYCNENLERLSALPGESVDLIYLDPPFFSNRTYEVIWGEEAEVRSFEDRWEGGILNYIDWLEKRALELHRVLKKTGSLYLHCDPHASHYIKVMLDRLFGVTNFRNEFVWRRTLAKGGQMGRAPWNHDTVLAYGKTVAAPWNEIRIPYDLENLDEKTLSKYSHRDVDGRLYRLDNLLHPEQGHRPNLDYELMGVRRTWRWSKDRMEKAVADGIVIQTAPGRVPQQKRYLDEQLGRLIDDVWIDINPINSQAAERIGYPTQKPAALLERIIGAASNPGDVVLDPFCGCGTTIAVAERMQRRWIGIDISSTAMRIMQRRLWNELRVTPDIVDMPSSEEAVRELKPFEFQNWVIDTMNGTHSPRKSNDMGIDGYSFLTKDPIQVKQSDRVGRNVVDNFETAMRRGKHDVGYIVAFSFTKDAVEEVARAKADGLKITLVKVKEVLLLATRSGNAPKKIGPQPEGDVLPLPAIRKPKDMPSAEELIASDKAS